MELNLLKLDYNDNQSRMLMSQLDWELILDDIAAHTHFELSRQAIGSKPIANSAESLNHNLDALDFIVKIIEQQRSYEIISTLTTIDPSSSLPGHIHRLQKVGILEIKHLNKMAILLESYQTFAKILKGWNKLDQYVFDHNLLMAIDRKFTRPFRTFVSVDGLINYHKHPQLSHLYSDLVSLDNSIRSRINNISREDIYRDKLQFDGHDILNDRYVLAIRSDSYNKNLGHIRGRSESGFTLYVEPFALVELTDQRIDILAEIDAILSRICHEFSLFLSQHHLTLDKIYTFCLELDQVFAKAHYCYSQNLVRPQLNDEMIIDIKSLFHPLIINPITNDISISKEKGFIISGPNTGGKTAALKAVTLCHLFANHGLFVPAIEANLPILDGIFFQGNDQQNISAGLSSFSAEVTNYLKLLEELGDRNLIVIDEIFNSTSSEEASALAIGLFNEIHSKSNSRLLVSTHHHMLKTLIHGDPEYISAHVGFDLESNQPTYKIIRGVPGSSMALTIFDNFSKSSSSQHDITKIAKTILDGKFMKYEILLQEIQQKEVELEKLINENRQINLLLKNQKDSMEGILKLKMSEELANFRKKMTKYTSEAEYLLEETRREKITTKKNLNKHINKIESHFKDEERNLHKMFDHSKNEQDPMLKLYSQKANNITSGKKYYSTTLKKIILVESLDERRRIATISFHNKSVHVPFDTLHEIPASQQGSPKEVHVTITKTHDNSKFQIDCRGMRLDEFKTMVEQSLSDLSMDKIPYLELIHGHGNGILKKWIRDYLRNLDEFYWERSDDDGITRIFNI